MIYLVGWVVTVAALWIAIEGVKRFNAWRWP